MSPTVVQSASEPGSGSSAVTVTLGSPTTAGNTLVTVVAYYGSTHAGSDPTIELGSTGDQWTSAYIMPTVATSASSKIRLNYACDFDCSGGQTSVVVTPNGQSGSSLGTVVWVLEVSGYGAAGLSGPDDAAGHVRDGHHPFDEHIPVVVEQPASSRSARSRRSGLVIHALRARAGRPTGQSSAPRPRAGAGYLNLMVGWQYSAAGGALVFNGSNSTSNIWTGAEIADRCRHDQQLVAALTPARARTPRRRGSPLRTREPDRTGTRPARRHRPAATRRRDRRADSGPDWHDTGTGTDSQAVSASTGDSDAARRDRRADSQPGWRRQRRRDRRADRRPAAPTPARGPIVRPSPPASAAPTAAPGRTARPSGPLAPTPGPGRTPERLPSPALTAAQGPTRRQSRSLAPTPGPGPTGRSSPRTCPGPTRGPGPTGR